MKKTLRAIVASLTGAGIGAAGLSSLALLLFAVFDPQAMKDSLEYWMLVFIFTVPCGAFVGGFVSFAWFLEART